MSNILDLYFTYQVIFKDDTKDLWAWNCFDLLAIEFYMQSSTHYTASKLPYDLFLLFFTSMGNF